MEQSSSCFLPFSATSLLRMLISFREERRGPVGVAGLRMGQARLQGLLKDGLNPGLSCNWNESPREETNFPQMEKAEPLPPENGPWLYNRIGLLAPVHADPEDRTSLVISSSGLPDISDGYLYFRRCQLSIPQPTAQL